MNRTHSPLRLGGALLAVLLASGAAAMAAPAPMWQSVHASELTVTSGSVFATGGSGLGTSSAEMRAVQRDHGRHAGRARLTLQFLANSPTTKPLGSGLIRRQIGLKLRAADPCNLLYVMWRTYPDRVIEISRKSNPGMHTSQECGNAGYSDLALIPEPGGVHRHHVLEADTRRTADGSLVLTVYADGRLARKLTLAPTEAAGLAGPIGVRSDNGSYRFRLSAARAPAAV
jgi:hypothetical protein